MSSPSPWSVALAARFARGFRAGPLPWRTVGRESEFPLVRADGAPGELAELWPHLAALDPALHEKRDPSGLLVELSRPGLAYVAEVGRGTVEIVIGPHDDLHGTRATHEAARGVLLEACARAGQTLLGSGIQPAAAPTAALMTAKQRYGVLHEVIGDGWLWFALTASDQVHGAIAADEIVLQTTVGHLVTPVMVALCANSPIQGGVDRGGCSLRELHMGTIQAAQGRHGLPLEPDADLPGMVARYTRQPWLVRYDGPACIPCEGSFDAALDRRGAPSTPVQDDAWADFLTHEHYIWNSARPRSAHGTIELRAACQQPLHEHMAACSFGFGAIEAAPALQRLFTDRFGDRAWPLMRAWHSRVIRDGLAAEEPAPGLIADVLRTIGSALGARGRGEEAYLDPLWRRLDARQNPAQAARAAFAAGGLPGLIAHAARV
jgi:gamma-glutamylcysteine synthetase